MSVTKAAHAVRRLFLVSGSERRRRRANATSGPVRFCNNGPPKQRAVRRD